ncbi:cilia- and flagella-associated protein 58 [Esox lucius]|uniref:Cilia- and flagella-associated protein 58 central coiled coil domain-containing protein n=1 Tax=Esox lucius TaxID=8010 RepID=A0A3P9ALP3_ESOLU|nr:cilia- and flagella-associated protein 58 [Esox lucius]
MEDKGQLPEEEDNSFELMEKEFQEILNELVGEKSLGKFRVEYEKLNNALKKSHESEKRLMTKCRELNAEIVSNSVKVATAMKLSQEDKTTITSMKKEIEKAWKMVDTAHDEELRARETIQTLKNDISNLTKLVEQRAGLSMGQEHKVSDLMKIKEELNKERDELLTEVVTLRNILTKATASQQEMEVEKQKAIETVSQLQQDIQVCQNECSRETRRKEKLEKEVKQLQMDLEAKQSDINVLNMQSQRGKEDQQRLEQQLREQKILNERATKELEQLQVRNTKLQLENEQNTLSMEQLSLDNQQKASDLKMKEEEVNHMRLEIAKVTKMREAIQRKFRQTEDQKLEVEQQRDMLKNQIAGLEKEMESSKKQMEIDKKAIDELVRERDILNKNMIKAANATEKQLNVVKLHEQSKKNLDQEIMNYREEAQKQRKIIYHLEKERDRYINEATELTHKVLQNMEDIKMREMQIFEYKKKIAEAESKLKQQQNLYEAIRSDRNLYSKNLIEAQDEITAMKRKLKTMNHQTDQLKEEISSKESAQVKEHQEFQCVEKEKEALKADLQKMKQQAQETKQFIESQETKERKLLKIIADADAERPRQKKELDQVISERDILGTQLVRRNDELALLYEKIKIQQSILNKGEIQYNQRVEDIRLLKMEIKKLRREKGILAKTVPNVDDIRHEVYHMQRELLKERMRCRALEEELEKPMNVHRWRRLEASDPSTYKLIQKIHSLQRDLITKSKEVVEKELLLQEKEKLYVELKHILARQPGPEAAEQLQNYQQTLRQKTKQLKALSAELKMYESQTQDYKYEIERQAHALQNIKKKYLNQKRKEQQSREERSLAQLEQSLILPKRSDGPRFTGGGFSLQKARKMTT